jgi:DNA-binding CsgD family transcriptional regulator
VSDFLDALRRVAAGGTALDPEVVAQLLVRRRNDPIDRLTPRELEVLRLMAEGRSNNGIRDALHVSSSAVEKYVSNIFAKLGLPPHRHRPPPSPGRPEIPTHLTQADRVARPNRRRPRERRRMDVADDAIQLARSLSTELSLPATFVRSVSVHGTRPGPLVAQGDQAPNLRKLIEER